VSAPAPEHTANLVSALALALADRTADAVGEVAGSLSAAAALSALHHFIGREGGVPPSVDTLRQVLGLTSSGAVRLVDRLQAAGLVERGPGADGRQTYVRLTPRGRRVARRVTEARAAVADTALVALSEAERGVFDDLVGKVLAGMVRGPGATRWTCRLCDTGACGRDAGACPVANEVARRVDRDPPG
jgi:DNA-binding MarR family transcriptional regulator